MPECEKNVPCQNKVFTGKILYSGILCLTLLWHLMPHSTLTSYASLFCCILCHTLHWHFMPHSSLAFYASLFSCILCLTLLWHFMPHSSLAFYASLFTGILCRNVRSLIFMVTEVMFRRNNSLTPWYVIFIGV